MQDADLLWEWLCLRVLLNPVYLEALWPDACALHPEMRQLLQRLTERLWVSDARVQAETDSVLWVLEQGDAEQHDTLMQRLLIYL